MIPAGTGLTYHANRQSNKLDYDFSNIEAQLSEELSRGDDETIGDETLISDVVDSESMSIIDSPEAELVEAEDAVESDGESEAPENDGNA